MSRQARGGRAAAGLRPLGAGSAPADRGILSALIHDMQASGLSGIGTICCMKAATI